MSGRTERLKLAMIAKSTIAAVAIAANRALGKGNAIAGAAMAAIYKCPKRVTEAEQTELLDRFEAGLVRLRANLSDDDRKRLDDAILGVQEEADRNPMAILKEVGRGILR